ncbi:amidase [Mycobacterium sp. URHB0044]|uniref:amidase n=1 Tax=Mycobacterium sp. URHB0044 TaxID=1380386 RepID=UPI000562B980|nr:amidase [Mycobacterium sp. URHB0044]
MTDITDTTLLTGYFRHHDIHSIAEDLRNGSITSVELVQHSLATIERLNPVLNAFTTVDARAAMASASQADDELARGHDRGFLHGIPVSVKDIIDVAGDATTSGSAIYLNRRVHVDAECVRRLRNAAAVIVGKNVLHEFAYGATGDRSVHGASRNPWDPTKISGGSSGGGAVAVAAGMVPLALGTDTAGSVRVPAALCGVVGFKPAFGAVPTEGVHPLAASLDHVGVFTRTATDAARAYAIIAADALARDAVPARVAWLDPNCIGPTDPAVITAVRESMDRAGVAVSGTVQFTFPVGELFSVLSTLQSSEAYFEHAEDLVDHRDDIDPEVIDRLERGRDTPAWQYVQAARKRQELRAVTAELFERFEVLVLPTAPTVATDVDQRAHAIDGQVVEVRSALLSLTSPWNLTGHPALTVPVGTVSGLPVGLQLVGMPGREHLLFDLAARVEHGRQ